MHKRNAGLASKKGIAITAAIAAGIVGASFLIWFLPQNSPGTTITPTNDYRDISNVYGRHNDLATEVDSEFEKWQAGSVTSESMSAKISSAEGEVADMKRGLADARPPQEWQESYGLYSQALDSYQRYLDAMTAKVQGGDKADIDPALKQEWQGLVNQSVEALPV